MCLTKPVGIECPKKVVCYKVFALSGEKLVPPVFSVKDKARNHKTIPVGVEVDEVNYRMFQSIHMLSYEFSTDVYDVGFHAFKFVGDAKKFARPNEVVAQVELSEVTAVGYQNIHSEHRHGDDVICFVGKKMKVLQVI